MPAGSPADSSPGEVDEEIIDIEWVGEHGQPPALPGPLIAGPVGYFQPVAVGVREVDCLADPVVGETLQPPLAFGDATQDAGKRSPVGNKKRQMKQSGRVLGRRRHSGRLDQRQKLGFAGCCAQRKRPGSGGLRLQAEHPRIEVPRPAQ